MPNTLIAAILAPVIGGVLASLVAVGLVSSQTSAPDQNPASKQVLTYGQ